MNAFAQSLLVYTAFPPVHIGWGYSVHLFEILVDLAIIVGTIVVLLRARSLRLSYKPMMTLLLLVFSFGFLGSHLATQIFYKWDALLNNPWRLLSFRNGMSSVGGMLGAGVAYFLWRWRFKPENPGYYFENIVYAFPFGWIFGRLGCTLTFDHPGIKTNFFLGVQFPDGLRHNLGMYECVVAIMIAIAFIIVDVTWPTRVRNRPYFFLNLFIVLYAPARFFLDFLRKSMEEGGDTRFLGLTFAQYVCAGFFVYCLALLLRTWVKERSVISVSKKPTAEIPSTNRC